MNIFKNFTQGEKLLALACYAKNLSSVVTIENKHYVIMEQSNVKNALENKKRRILEDKKVPEERLEVLDFGIGLSMMQVEYSKEFGSLIYKEVKNIENSYALVFNVDPD